MINKIENTCEEEFQMSLCFLEKHWLSEVKVRRYSRNIISQYSQENTYVGKYHFFKDLQACNFIKKRLQHRCFPVNTANFLRTVFLTRPVTAPGF